MSYNQDFLNGLAAGLTATAASPIWSTPLYKLLTTGTDRLRMYPDGEFDVFVNRFVITTPFAVTISYEYGPDDNHLQRVFRRVGASAETQTLYHVVELPEAVSLYNYKYNVYLHERVEWRTVIRFDTRFMIFPYYVGQQSWLYPGSPELVTDWLTRTYR